MTNPEKIVQEQLDFYNNHDIEGFLSTYHDDIKLYNLVEGTLMLEGKEAMRERYTNSFDVLNIHADLANRIIIGNKVIDHEKVTANNREGISNAAAVYEVIDGLIKNVWFVRES